MVDNIRRLAIGTAQFGMDYGIANMRGQVTTGDAREVLQIARDNGIDTVDTAVAYGTSQRALGEIGIQGLRVVTKLPAYTASEAEVTGWVDRIVTDTLHDLQLRSIYGLMFHHAEDLAGTSGPALYREVRRLRDAGVVSKVGVSVYDPNILSGLGGYEFDLVQAPYNVFDQRITDSGWLDRLVERGVEVHARSVFLQGLLLMHSEKRPAYFGRWSDQFIEWDDWCEKHAIAPLEAALNFVLGDDRIARVLVGVDGAAQLLEIFDAARNMNAGDRFEGAGINDPDLVNPSSWKGVR